jgi:hypothetical protein
MFRYLSGDTSRVGAFGVGVFVKVMLAVAILVANGALLFFILRFLLWLAFPAMKGEREARPARTAPAAAVNVLGTASAATATEMAAASATQAAPGGPPPFASIAAPRPRAYPHRLLIGLPVILALFAGGVWLGSIVGGSGDASAATKIIHVPGQVVTVNSTRTVLSVPGTNIVVTKGSVVTVPPQTLLLPSRTITRVVHRTRTETFTRPGSTTVVTTAITIPPTTITETGTTLTVTVTATSTVTTTDTTGTTTTT